MQHYKLFYRHSVWLEGLMGAENTNVWSVVEEENYTCGHHVVFAAVFGKHRWHGSVKERTVA